MSYCNIEQEEDLQSLRLIDKDLIEKLKELKKTVEMESSSKLKTDTIIFEANAIGLGATIFGLTVSPLVLPAAAVTAIGSGLYQYYNNSIYLEKTVTLEKRFMDLLKDRDALCNVIKAKLGRSFKDDFWKAVGAVSNSNNAINIATHTSKQFIKGTGKFAKHQLLAATGVRISSKVFTGLIGYGMLLYEGYSLLRAYKTTPELSKAIDIIIEQIENFYNDSNEEIID